MKGKREMMLMRKIQNKIGEKLHLPIIVKNNLNNTINNHTSIYFQPEKIDKFIIKL